MNSFFCWASVLLFSSIRQEFRQPSSLFIDKWKLCECTPYFAWERARLCCHNWWLSFEGALVAISVTASFRLGTIHGLIGFCNRVLVCICVCCAPLGKKVQWMLFGFNFWSYNICVPPWKVWSSRWNTRQVLCIFFFLHSVPYYLSFCYHSKRLRICTCGS